VVLDHIAGDPDAIEVSGATADADVFGHRDLDMVDVVVVPHRLEEFVGEPQRQHVLHSLLAKIVIDAEHRGGREDAEHDPVQFPSAGEIVAERFFDHHPTPPTGVLLGQAMGA
jgi:hypothetical protein